MNSKHLLLAILSFFIAANIAYYKYVIPIYGSLNAGYGSYGAPNVEFTPEKDSEMKKVFFLGNSAYYGTEVIPELNELIEAKSFQFQTANFGFTGASIFDYIYTYTHIKQYNPDLLVVQFFTGTFVNHGPKYRNDSFKSMFKSSGISLLKNDFIRRSFKKEDLTYAISCQLFPLAFNARLLRKNCNNYIKDYCKENDLLPYNLFFPNRINGVGEWAQNQKKQKEERIDNNSDETEPDALLALKLFMEMLEKDSQEALFIIQPNDFDDSEVLDSLEFLVKKIELIHFRDNRQHFFKAGYKDKIHANNKGAKEAADRTYGYIKELLNN